MENRLEELKKIANEKQELCNKNDENVNRQFTEYVTELLKDLNTNVSLSYDLREKLNPSGRCSYYYDRVRITLSHSDKDYFYFTLYIYDDKIGVNNGCCSEYDKEDIYFKTLKAICILFDNDKEILEYAHSWDRNPITEVYNAKRDYAEEKDRIYIENEEKLKEKARNILKQGLMLSYKENNLVKNIYIEKVCAKTIYYRDIYCYTDENGEKYLYVYSRCSRMSLDEILYKIGHEYYVPFVTDMKVVIE